MGINVSTEREDNYTENDITSSFQCYDGIYQLYKTNEYDKLYNLNKARIAYNSDKIIQIYYDYITYGSFTLNEQTFNDLSKIHILIYFNEFKKLPNVILYNINTNTLKTNVEESSYTNQHGLYPIRRIKKFERVYLSTQYLKQIEDADKYYRYNALVLFFFNERINNNINIPSNTNNINTNTNNANTNNTSTNNTNSSIIPVVLSASLF